MIETGLAVTLQRCDVIAPTELPVLILGASGTGKELVARRIHDHSRRASKRFVAVNCAGLPPDLMERELFGHEQGAFTGAGRGGPGWFEAAHGGTLFLDEIGDLPSSAQGKVLRVLETKTVARLGSQTERSTDVRIVAATNRRLASLSDSVFRKDLLYRLDQARIELPPLSARGAQAIVEFVKFFCAEIAADIRPAGITVGSDALEAIRLLPLPGNARELRNILISASVEAMVAAEPWDGILRPQHLRPEVPLQGTIGTSPLRLQASRQFARYLKPNEVLNDLPVDMALAAEYLAAPLLEALEADATRRSKELIHRLSIPDESPLVRPLVAAVSLAYEYWLDTIPEAEWRPRGEFLRYLGLENTRDSRFRSGVRDAFRRAYDRVASRRRHPQL